MTYLSNPLKAKKGHSVGLKVEDDPHLHPGVIFPLWLVKKSMDLHLHLADSGKKHYNKGNRAS